jgi:uncharacterized membrane protein
MTFVDVAEIVGEVIDGIGVAVIVVGTLAALALTFARRTEVDDHYEFFRRRLGRSILLSLEFLVAADIIRTVAITPTLQDLAVLAGIIVIRTFLSFALQLELTGRWPWQAIKTARPDERKVSADTSENR